MAGTHTIMENLSSKQISTWTNKKDAKVLAYRAYGGKISVAEDLAKLRSDIKSSLNTTHNPIVAAPTPENRRDKKDSPPFCMLVKGISTENARELIARVGESPIPLNHTLIHAQRFIHWGRGPMETGVYMLGTFQALSQSSSNVPTRYSSFTFKM